jgi:lipopolysaccharide biosynthesis glycosyltransferase
VRWNDQYALNVVLSGRWGQLDLRWNQAAHIFSYPSWSLSPFDRETFEQLRDDPYIIHFTTCDKPWLATCLHPSRKLFFECVDRTAWAGWRPSRFTHPRAFFGLLKAHKRRVRQARKRLQCRVFDWLQRYRSPATR